MQIVRNSHGQVQPSPPEPCSGCGVKMLGQYAHRALSPDQRRKYRRHQGHGLCSRCYRSQRGEYAGHADRWSRDDLIYEWKFLAGQGYDRRAAAKRLHVSYAALCKAIERHLSDVNREELAS